MKAIVIYKSNTGFTKKYAEWIAETLSCKTIPIEKAKTKDLNHYDTLIFGGWLFAGKIQGLKDFRKISAGFQGKKAVFATGSTPPEAPTIGSMLSSCFTVEEQKTTGIFYMHGGLNYSRMGMMHRVMMKMMCSIMKKQKGIDSTEYKTISQSFDATVKDAISPLINYLTGI